MEKRYIGIDLHRISLGALVIALGLLVDDAMIAVEMMDRKLREGLDRLAAATDACHPSPSLIGARLRSPHEPDRVLLARWRHAGSAVPDIAPLKWGRSSGLRLLT